MNGSRRSHRQFQILCQCSHADGNRLPRDAECPQLHNPPTSNPPPHIPSLLILIRRLLAAWRCRAHFAMESAPLLVDMESCPRTGLWQRRRCQAERNHTPHSLRPSSRCEGGLVTQLNGSYLTCAASPTASSTSSSGWALKRARLSRRTPSCVLSPSPAGQSLAAESFLRDHPLIPKVAAAAAPLFKKLSLELGGKNATLPSV